jgi:hypothetical protein
MRSYVIYNNVLSLRVPQFGRRYSTAQQECHDSPVAQ